MLFFTLARKQWQARIADKGTGKTTDQEICGNLFAPLKAIR
ncbi:hypothetical protein [uncultured Varibaculum sp.]|nr:hypothetical protein [uncultured Varibaculum sp.]